MVIDGTLTSSSIEVAYQSQETKTAELTVTDQAGIIKSITGGTFIEVCCDLELTEPAENITVECDGTGNTANLTAWLNNHGGAVATDAQGVIVNWSTNPLSPTLSNDCGSTGSVTVTFTASDVCGMSVSTTATFTIEDNTPPALTGSLPSGETGMNLCFANIPAGPTAEVIGALYSDLCGTVNVIKSGTPTGTSCSWSVTYSYAITDDCGNQVLPAPTVTYSGGDNSVPTWVTAPGALNVTLECSDATGLAAAQAMFPTAQDNCDPDVTNVVRTPGAFVPGACPDEGTYTNTWTVTDACEKTSATYTQVITITDNTPPALTGSLPSGETGMNLCFANIPAGPTAEVIGALYSDLCGTVNVIKSGTPTGTSCSWSVTYSYAITDDCGNQVLPAPTVTYSGGDNSVPTWVTAPGALNVTLECSDATGLAAAQAMFPAAQDNCDPDVTNVVRTPGAFVPGACPDEGTYTNTWTVTDACEKTSATYTQVITITDNTPPALTGSLPSGETGMNLCFANIPAGPTAEVIGALYSDLCGTVNVIKSGTPTGTSCSWSVTYSYAITDDCGNQVLPAPTVTYSGGDNSVPTWVTAPLALNVTLECSDATGLAAAQAMFPAAQDNCDPDVTNVVRTPGAFVPGACPDEGTYTNTWTVTDACEKTSATYTQVITITDNTPPALTGSLPSGATGMNLCFANVPAGPTAEVIGALYSDLCGTVNVIKSGTPTGSSCSWSVTYSYAITDDCGNQVLPAPTVTYSGGDNSVPTWVTAPLALNVTLECSDATGLAAAQAMFPAAQDNCDPDVTNVVRTPGAFVPGACPDEGTYTNTWTVTDACEKTSATYTQVITITDNTPPALTGSLPSGETGMNLCFANIPAGPTAEVIGALYSDLCGTVNVIKSGTPTGTSCSWSVTYSYAITDDCGNQVLPAPTVTYSGGDNSVPTWVTAPGALNVTLECSDATGLAAAQAMFPTAQDNCDPDVTNVVRTPGAFVPGACPDEGTYTNTWTVTDACEKTSATYTQVITITDNTPPALTGSLPSGETGMNLCFGNIPAGPTAEVIGALYSDLCGTVNVIKSGTPTGTSCSWSVTYSYAITDDCGNQVLPAPTVTYSGGDKGLPVMATPPVAVTFECNEDIPAPGLLGWTDNCDGTGEVLGVDLSDGRTCPETITRTWSYTDACGNSASVSQTITVVDTQIPVLEGVPDNTTVECDAIPDPPAVIATDNCDTDVEINYQQQFGSCNNNGRNVNASGNGMVWDIVISETGLTASDINKLSLIFETNKGKGVAEFTLISPSGQGVMLVGPYCNSGECILPNEPHTVYMPVFYKCSEDYDKWNNSLLYPAGIEMEFEPYGGTTSPNEDYIEALLAGEGLTWQGYVPCFDDFTGNMDGTWRIYSRKQEEAIGEVKFIGACLMPGQCPQEYSITRSWTAIDNCGNESTESQLIKVQDNKAPVFENCPATVVLGFPQTPNEAMAISAVGAITDNCGTPDINAVGGTINDTDNPCVKTQIWTVAAVDECGNIGTCEVTFTITVDDGKPVFFGCPEDPIDLGCNPVAPVCGDAIALVSVTDGCTDNILIPVCSAGPVVTVGCQKTQIFTLTATDDQGHTATCDVTYTWKEDVTPPVLPVLPAGGDLGCNPQVLPACTEGLMATDICDGQIPVSCIPGQVTGGCNKSQTFTYSATDGCRNTSTATVTYTWKADIELPVISTTAVNNSNLGCNPVVSAPLFTGLDNCDGAFLPIVNTTGLFIDGCFYTQTWIATYTDGCLNQATPVEITYTWTVDDQLPVLATGATSHDLGCNPTVTAPLFTGTDNCMGQINPVVTTSGPTNRDCTYSQSWTANFTDDCKNAAVPMTITYTWTVDTDKPVISTTETNRDLGCNPAVPVPEFTGTDNCEGTIKPVVTTGGPIHMIARILRHGLRPLRMHVATRQYRLRSPLPGPKIRPILSSQLVREHRLIWDLIRLNYLMQRWQSGMQVWLLIFVVR